MRDFDENSITDAVIDRFANTPDPRLKTLLTSLTRRLHDFVKDVEPTFDEWLYAIAFLKRTGQISVGGREEFILLSDTLGVSMLIDAINHRMPEGATATTVLGPFYLPDAREMQQGADLAAGLDGEPLYCEIEVLSAGGAPLSEAVVDVWQSDDEGFYDIQKDGDEQHLRGRFRTDADGKLRFWSITPTAYPIPYDGPVGDLLKASARHPYRPAHLHFMIAAPGYETLVTHLFVAGDKYLDSDAVFGVKQSLIDAFPERNGGQAPDGRSMSGKWRLLNYAFGLKPTT